MMTSAFCRTVQILKLRKHVMLLLFMFMGITLSQTKEKL